LLTLEFFLIGEQYFSTSYIQEKWTRGLGWGQAAGFHILNTLMKLEVQWQREGSW
jgi:hypothetical protein